MPITTERRRQRQDPFDWLTRQAAHAPGARALARALARRQATRRWIWFVAIYVVSVIVFGAVALFLNAIVPS